MDFGRLGQYLAGKRGAVAVSTFVKGVLSQSHVSKIERGAVNDLTLSTLVKVSDIYGENILVLLDLLGLVDKSGVIALLSRRSAEEQLDVMRALKLGNHVTVEATLPAEVQEMLALLHKRIFVAGEDRELLEELRRDNQAVLNAVTNLMFEIQSSLETRRSLGELLDADADEESGQVELG